MSSSTHFVTAVNIIEASKRKYPSKHYVYTINVIWSNKKQQLICRRYSKFFTLQVNLIETFPGEAGVDDPTKRILPFLPGKILFGRSQVKNVANKRKELLNEYLQKLIQLPCAISCGPIVLEFLEATPEDVQSLADGNVKTTTREQTLENISDPLLLEQFVVSADFNKTEKNQVCAKAGDTVEVIEKDEKGWWFVSIDDEQGWIPASYLESIDGSTSPEITVTTEEKCICCKTFVSTASDEISLDVGDIVAVLSKCVDGWWKVRLPRSNGCGYVPAVHLQALLVSVGSIKNPSPPQKSTKAFSAPPRKSTIKRNGARIARSEEVIYEAVSRFQSPDSANTLNVCAGDRVEVLNKDPNGWWYARSGGKKGWVPARVLDRGSSKSTSKPRIEERYVSRGNFVATEKSSMSLLCNQIVHLIEKDPSGWWLVKGAANEGWVPSDYLTLYEEISDRKKTVMTSNAKPLPPKPAARGTARAKPFRNLDQPFPFARPNTCNEPG